MITPQKKHELRNQYDKYLTPYSIIQQLLDNLEIDKDASILEPCSSVERTIGTVLKDNHFTNVTENIYFANDPSTDIFNLTGKYDYIITNTPYGKVIPSFVSKMKELTNKYVIALYPISTLHSTTRYKELWSDVDYGLEKVFMFVRPPWLKDKVQKNGKYDTGINAYGWFVWKKNYNGNITLKLIDNSQYCNKKSDDRS